MKNLIELQNSFAEFLQSDNLSEELEQLIIPGGRLETSRQALQVYQAGYTARLVEALAELLPCIRIGLGEELFNFTAENYFKRYPSTSYSLSAVGKNFPRFLRENSSLCEAVEYLDELAEFELSFETVFHQARDRREIVKLEESKPLDLPESLLVKSYRFDVYSMWKVFLEIESTTVSVQSLHSQQTHLTLFKNSEGLVQIDYWSEQQLAIIVQLMSLPLTQVELSGLSAEKIQQLFQLLTLKNLIRVKTN